MYASDLKGYRVNEPLPFLCVGSGCGSGPCCHPWLPYNEDSRRLHALEAEVELGRALGRVMKYSLDLTLYQFPTHCRGERKDKCRAWEMGMSQHPKPRVLGRTPSYQSWNWY